MASHRPPRTSHRAGQGGFSLLEILVGMLIGLLVVAAAVFLFNFATGQERRSTGSISASNSAFRTGNRFADDIASVSPVAGVSDPVAVGVTGCGGSSAVLRLVGTDGSGQVQVRSYHRVVDGSRVELERRSCVGATEAAALAAAPSASTVVTALDPGPGAVSVTCDGGPVGPTCRVVEMTVRTADRLTFTVRGTVGSVLAPTATTTPTPVQAPDVGTCTIMASATTWGATGGYAGSSTATHGGDPLMATYNDSNTRRSFMKFDLTQPCADASPVWPTLPGGRNLTNAVLQLAWMGDSSDSCGIFPGINYDGQVIEPLGDTAVWDEATLNGSNMPSGSQIRSGFSHNFSAGAQNTLVSHSSAQLLDAVKHWYAPNDWVNNGWRLSRSGGGDTCGRSNLFASRFNANVDLRPRLVISWGP